MAKAGNFISWLMWVQGPMLIQAGKNCRLRHNMNAINDGLGGVCAVEDMESESYRVAVQSRTSGLVSTK